MNLHTMNFNPGKIRPVYEKLTAYQYVYLNHYVNQLGDVIKDPDYVGHPIKDSKHVENWVKQGTAIIVGETSIDANHVSDNGNFYSLKFGFEVEEGAAKAGYANLGFVEDYYSFINDTKGSQGLTISGTLKEKSLTSFADLTRGGKRFRTTSITYTASDKKVFDQSPVLKKIAPTGIQKEGELIPYPDATADVQQVLVRVLKGPLAEKLVFDGTNFLTLPIPIGTSLSLTINGYWE